MGAIYSRISRIHVSEKQEEKLALRKEVESSLEQISEPKTPCSTIPKYLLDPRSATAEIKRTPLVILRENMSATEEADSTPLGYLPYLETDLNSSICTIRTSTPILSASPMKEILHPSPVLSRSESFNGSINEPPALQQDDLFNLDSEEEDGTEQLFNNERMLFESYDQGSFDDEKEEEDDKNVVSCAKEEPKKILIPEIYLLSEDSFGIDNEVEEILCDEITSATAENSLERQFSEIEDCVFSAVNPSVDNPGVIKSLSNCAPQVKLDNHLIKNKTGRTPLGIVSSNPCSPMQHVNLIISNNTDVAKTWRGLNEERVNRGICDVENTPPTSNLPPPDIIQSAPGKLLLNRGRTGKAAWGRDSSLVI